VSVVDRLPEAPPLRRDTMARSWLGLRALSDAGDQVWTIALAWTAVHVASPAAAGLVVPVAFQPAIVVLSFLTGLMFPLRAASIQRAAADGVRARAASLASACDKVLATVALLVAGVAPRGRSR